MEERLYIIVRNDLGMSLQYQGVQGGHALAQWLIDNPNQTWNNSYLIYLQTDNIEKLMFKLDIKNIKYSKFIEPDIGNELTAIALQVEDVKILENLKLMGA
jgi:hypothetical protein